LKVGRFVLANLLAKFPLEREEPSGSTLAGAIGGEFLRRFLVVIDFSRGKLILKPNSQLNDPDETSMDGMGISASGPDFKEFRVGAVLPNSLRVRLTLRRII